jgi:hypothetical protein
MIRLLLALVLFSVIAISSTASLRLTFKVWKHQSGAMNLRHIRELYVA